MTTQEINDQLLHVGDRIKFLQNKIAKLQEQQKQLAIQKWSSEHGGIKVGSDVTFNNGMVVRDGRVVGFTADCNPIFAAFSQNGLVSDFHEPIKPLYWERITLLKNKEAC